MRRHTVNDEDPRIDEFIADLELSKFYMSPVERLSIALFLAMDSKLVTSPDMRQMQIDTRIELTRTFIDQLEQRLDKNGH